MDFTISTRGGNKKQNDNVSVPKHVVEHVIDLLSNVECTCVWSSKDQSYLKVNDIDNQLVDDLKSAVALSKLANG